MMRRGEPPRLRPDHQPAAEGQGEGQGWCEREAQKAREEPHEQAAQSGEEAPARRGTPRGTEAERRPGLRTYYQLEEGGVLMDVLCVLVNTR